MRKLTLIAPAVVLFALSFHAIPAVAQNGPPTLAEIERMLDSAKMIDPEIERYLPRWKVQEADLKIKIAQYFKLEGIPVKETDSMIVTATFARPGQDQELISIRAGAVGALSGTQQIRRSLGDAIYTSIRERNYAHTVIEPATPSPETQPERIGYVMQPGTAKQFVAASAYRQVVLIGATGARLEHWIGNDEIGYHFWSSGQAKGLVTYPVIPLTDPDLRAKGVPDILTVQIGAAYRLKFGQAGDDFLGGVISPRKLNGSIGAKAVARVDYRLPQLNDIGFSVNAEIPFNKLTPEFTNVADGSIVSQFVPAKLTPGPGTARDTVAEAYFLRTVAQGSVFWETWLNDYEHFFRISVGASYQEIGRAAIAGDTDLDGNLEIINYAKPGADNIYPDGIVYTGLVHPTELKDWLFAKVEYLNQSGFPFGMTAQLANRNLLLSGYIPVVPNWLFLEAKYSTPILRDSPAPWEQRSFFMISPILRFKIGSN